MDNYDKWRIDRKTQKLPLDLEVYDWNYYIVDEPIVRDIEVPSKVPDEYETKTVVFLQ